MTPTLLDLNDTNGKAKLEWTTVETPAEEAARLTREDREHVSQIKMRWALFTVAVTAVVLVAGVGVFLALTGNTPEVTRLGVGILTAVVTGALGFLSGRATAPTSR